MSARQPYNYWSEEEIAQLRRLVKKHRNAYGKVDWEAIGAEMSGRAPKTCKSFYYNVVAKGEERAHVNFCWEGPHLWALMAAQLRYGRGAEMLQSKVFPELRTFQIKGKVYQAARTCSELLDHMRRLSPDSPEWVFQALAGLQFLWLRRLQVRAQPPRELERHLEEVGSAKYAELLNFALEHLEETFDLQALFSVQRV